MLRALLALLALLAVLAPRDARAQCAAYGTTCNGGQSLICLNSAPPRIGTGWQLGMQAACGNPSQNVLLLGSCLAPGLPLLPPLACSTCSSCRIHVFPILTTIAWTWPPRVTTIPIPNNPILVGQAFCIQNACTTTASACFCLSNAMRVTVMR